MQTSFKVRMPNLTSAKDYIGVLKRGQRTVMPLYGAAALPQPTKAYAAAAAAWRVIIRLACILRCASRRRSATPYKRVPIATVPSV